MTSPAQLQGTAADAIRSAEAALAWQNSVAAHIDLQVITAVLNAHGTRTEGVEALDRLQREIEAAVTSWAGLDTPAGARAFQRYLIDKLGAIRAVLDTADLDATSKAALAAALAALYASAVPGTPDPDPPPPGAPPDGSAPPGPDEPAGPAPPPEPAAAAAPLPMPALTGGGWGGGAPSGAGLSSLPGLTGLGAGLGVRPRGDTLRDVQRPGASDESEESDESGESEESGQPAASDTPGSTVIRLPGGQQIAAPSPELAAVITAAVAGTPIAEAFRQQGIALPAPGSVPTALVAPDSLVPGDVGFFADHHALALGEGKALLDNEIRSVTDVAGPGFAGWQHPPPPAPELPPVPAAAAKADPS